MKVRAGIAAGMSVLAMLSSAASAQTQPAPAPQPEAPLAQDAEPSDDIVVTGTRAGLQDALSYKRRSNNIVDVITSDDIGELPDNNVAESLQRITGVQIERNQGVGARVRIRGLSANTLINGRELVGSSELGSDGGNTRQFNFRNLASDFFEALEVSKSIRADQIEGALGGVVNLVTRKPTELNKRILSASLLTNYGDRSEKFGIGGNFTYGDKFADNRLGVILALSYEKNAIREDVFMVRGGYGAFDVGRNTGFNFDADAATNEALKPVDLRFLTEDQQLQRFGANAAVNWEVTDNLDVRVDGLFLQLDNKWRRFFLRTLFDTSFQADSLRISDIGAITAGTFLNQRVQPDGRDYPERQRTFQGGINVAWRADRLSVTGDLNYSRSERTRVEQFLRYQGFENATVTYDLNARGGLPSVVLTTAGGAPYDLSTPSRYFTELHFDRIFEGYQDKWEAKLDGTLELDAGPLRRLLVGFRGARTRSEDILTQAEPQAPVASNPAFFVDGQRRPIDQSPISQFVGTSPGGFFSGLGTNVPSGWVAGKISDIGIDKASERFTRELNLRSAGFVLQATAFSQIDENTYAGYAAADLEGTALGVDYAANVGVRAVRTELSSTGIVTTPAQQRITIDNDYTDFLPAANVKFDLSDRLVMRLAAAKSLERAPFGNLIAGFQIDLSSGTARGGNPQLKPFRANQFDASFEFYRSKDGAYSLTLFYKDIQNFITTATESGEIPGFTRLDGGSTFLITRPINGGPATIKGFEVSAQEALTFLPGVLDGLGFVANYTFSDIKTATPEPFQNLSRHAYNLIGYYNKGPIDFRVAYSWRSRFASFAEGGNAAQRFGLFEYTGGQGFLDGSMSVDLSEQVRLRFEAFNITNTVQRRFLESSENLRNIFVQDRRFVFGVRVAL